jgi:hypothetical protein
VRARLARIFFHHFAEFLFAVGASFASFCCLLFIELQLGRVISITFVF